MSGNLVDITGLDLEGTLSCRICDSESYGPNSESEWWCLNSYELCEILEYIISSLTRPANLRIAAAVALRRTLMHTSGLKYMQLTSSVFREFCLNSLRSSVRELRLIIGYGLTIGEASSVLTPIQTFNNLFCP